MGAKKSLTLKISGSTHGREFYHLCVNVRTNIIQSTNQFVLFVTDSSLQN